MERGCNRQVQGGGGQLVLQGGERPVQLGTWLGVLLKGSFPSFFSKSSDFDAFVEITWDLARSMTDIYRFHAFISISQE